MILMDKKQRNPVPLVLTLGATGFLCALGASLLTGQKEKSHLGSRGTAEGVELSSDAVKEVMTELDPIDSLYFDVSVARHSLEGGDITRAKTWLDSKHALGELHRSIRLGLIRPQEGGAIEGKINEAAKLMDEGRTSDAFRKLADLQYRTGELTYSAIAGRFKEKGLDPPEHIDARFEPVREKKIAEWKAKGYRPGLIEKALLWAEEWSRGIARRFIRDPDIAARVAESIYPEALELSERYLQAMSV